MPAENEEKTRAENLREIRSYWELYRELSYELKKYIDQQDIDEFLNVARQVDAIVEKMKKNPLADAYRASDEARKIAAEVTPIEREVIYKARAWLNKSRRQNSTVQSYDLTELSLHPAGNIFNRKY